MSAEGLDELEIKLDQLADVDLNKAIGNAIQTVRSTAVMNVHVDTGELRQSIYAEVEDNGDTATGVCWTNKPYATYLEFGTGPKGQENHAGISPEITPAYTQNPWWIHESQVDRRVAEKYHWFYIDTPDGRFYQCTGQPAYPFMYPALKDSQDQILEGMKADFSAAVKESIK